MTVEIRKPQTGDKVAQYTIRSKLGSGGMGDVYLCDDAALSRTVAVKIMHSYDQSDTDIVNRFILEGKALAKLTHPNIVSVFGLGEDNGFLYIAMEHVAGRSLFQITRDRSLTIREMISIFSDIAAGLDHAHSHGIVHRDIKPANILVDGNGRAKIIDFGIAKVIGGNGGGSEGVKTKTGAVIGTLNYIAPELFRGIDPSPSSDIYALGLLFAEMLTGRTPFKGESQFATMELIRDGKIDIPDNLLAVLPPEAIDALYKIIDREPENRPISASSAAQLLKSIEFPNLPSYFNSELVSVRIENVEELQDQLEAQKVDPAEWQFILALAVRTQAMRGDEEPSEDTTRLIERTGLHIPQKILLDSIENYRKDLESIITMQRSDSLSSLTPPPPVGQITPHTHSVEVQPMIQPPPSPAQGVRVAPEPVKSGSGKWIAAAILVALLGGGVYYQQMRTQAVVEDVREAVAQAEAANNGRRRMGESVSAPPVTEPTSGTNPTASSGFAMVVEPSTDAWPPIDRVDPKPGDQHTWKWKVRSTQGGDATFVERRIFDGVDQGLLKYTVVRLARNPSGSGVVSQPAGTEWYVAGFNALPRKTLQSKVFGSVGGAAVGQPAAIFPLRKGKEVQFELSYKSTEPVSWTPLVPLSTGFLTNYRSACSVRDKISLNVQGSLRELVKVDCYTKTDSGEISDVIYWSPDLGAELRHDRRVSSTSNGVITEVSMSGERVEASPGEPATSRQPAQNPNQNR